MKESNFKLCLGILLFSLMACGTKNKENKTADWNTSSAQNENTNDMNSFVSIFEIPATDISRAVSFYQTILEIKIEKMNFEEMEMGIFPYQNQMITGIIIKGDDFKPSANGPIIYLNGGDDLQGVLDKVIANGGQVITPKTAHADESGFFALFLDSEGNKMGLHSSN